MARLFNDASSQYLTVASAPVPAVPLTLAAWFNSDDITIGQSILHIGVAGTSNNRFTLNAQGDTAGDPVRALTRNTSTVVAATTTGYSANTWHHACGVFSAVDARAAYIDGGSKGTDTNSQTPTGIARTDVGTLSAVGSYFSGLIAEAAIWNVALTDDEVAILAKGFSPLFVRPESLIFYVPLIQSADKDIVGGLSLTATNTPTVGAHPRVFYPSSPIMLGVPAAAPPAGNPWYAYAQM